MENVFVYMNMFPVCLENGMARYCLKKLAPFKHNKTDALLGWFYTIGEKCNNKTTWDCHSLLPKGNLMQNPDSRFPES